MPTAAPPARMRKRVQGGERQGHRPGSCASAGTCRQGQRQVDAEPDRERRPDLQQRDPSAASSSAARRPARPRRQRPGGERAQALARVAAVALQVHQVVQRRRPTRRTARTRRTRACARISATSLDAVRCEQRQEKEQVLRPTGAGRSAAPLRQAGTLPRRTRARLRGDARGRAAHRPRRRHHARGGAPAQTGTRARELPA